MHFRVQDFTELVGAARYDVVIAEHSLHHLAPMPEVVSTIAGLLEPDGLFFVDEYVGPDRFQWPDRQLAEAQAVLETFPARLRSPWWRPDPRTRWSGPAGCGCT